jgi:hypothetical protein
LSGILEKICREWHLTRCRTPGKILQLRRKSPYREPVDVVRPKGAIRSIPMLDILMLALGLGFFALAIGYTYACERL